MSRWPSALKSMPWFALAVAGSWVGPVVAFVDTDLDAMGIAVRVLW